MKRLIMYHDDADGRCAAAIVRKWSHGQGIANLAFVPMQYGETDFWRYFEEPDPFEKDQDEFFMLDFSLPIEQMRKIREIVGCNFTWIDHHYTAIEALGGELDYLAGIRDSKTAACLLTWMYFFDSPTWAVPYPVKLIADRDMWLWHFGDDSRYFYEAYLQMHTEPWQACWNDWLSMDTPPADELAAGTLLYHARINGLKRIAKRIGWEDSMEGTGFSVMSLNYPASGDMGQVVNDMGYDVAHCYNEQKRGGRLQVIHSMYSKTVDVGAIAKERGGGGHKEAAGWTEMRI
jgi:oligoribonuclease NrnB/cAMP/cGMP phosphodiesterase (DHH superfamily)